MNICIRGKLFSVTVPAYLCSCFNGLADQYKCNYFCTSKEEIFFVLRPNMATLRLFGSVRFHQSFMNEAFK